MHASQDDYFNYGLFKVSKMTYNLFKVSKITTMFFDLFKVSKITSLIMTEMTILIMTCSKTVK